MMTQTTCVPVKITVRLLASVSGDWNTRRVKPAASPGSSGLMNYELKLTINSINPVFFCFFTLTCILSLLLTHTVINAEASHPNRTWSWCCRAGILQERKKRKKKRKETPSSLTRSSCQLGKCTANENHYQLQDRPDTAARRFNEAVVPLKQKEITCAAHGRTHARAYTTIVKCRQSVCHPPSFYLFVSTSVWPCFSLSMIITH